MQDEILSKIVTEVRHALVGGVLGKIYQLSRETFVIDLRRREAGFLFVSTEAFSPRMYLAHRATKQLDKQSQPLGEFGQSLRSTLTGATLKSIEKDENERVVRLRFNQIDETGEKSEPTLVVQLTGRSASLFLLNEDDVITHAQRSLIGSGQQVGESYQLANRGHKIARNEPSFSKGDFESLSAAADSYYQNLASLNLFETNAASALNKLRRESAKLEKLRKHLQSDLEAHGDPEQHKRLGDLLLANVSQAERNGNKVRLKDFYTTDAPMVEIEIDQKTSLQAEAGKYFARYAKSKRAAKQISERLTEIGAKLAGLNTRKLELEKVIADRDEEALAKLLPATRTASATRPKQKQDKIPGVRRYLSSDGYEVLVGRAAKDNDNLTFRIARAQDLWLHAADYPGSHVVVRNPTRKDLPHRTVIEAAELAAKFSQAGDDSRVNVNYTQQKFVSRIKGAAPGLVRLSSFRTIVVEPKEGIERL